MSKKTIFVVSTLAIVLTVIFFIILKVFSINFKRTLTTPLIPQKNTSFGNLNNNEDEKRSKLYPINITSNDSYFGKADQITAIAEKEKLLAQLPIYIKNFQATPEITTNISIYTLEADPADIIHYEILGVNYNVSSATFDNPEALAFANSFKRMNQALIDKKISLNNLHILFGTKDYIHKTAVSWINTLLLLK